MTELNLKKKKLMLLNLFLSKVVIYNNIFTR